jgi:hypothetical protein
MPFDNANLLVSLVLLQNQGITPDKAVPASIGAALIPGVLGLIVPLAVANADSGGTITGGTQTLVRVPDVTRATEQDAKRQLEAKNLIASSDSVFVDDADVSEGDVIDQDPKPDKFVPQGTTVTITVSLGPKPDSGDEAAELDIIRKDVEENTKKLDQILAAIAKDVNGSPGTSSS